MNISESSQAKPSVVLLPPRQAGREPKQGETQINQEQLKTTRLSSSWFRDLMEHVFHTDLRTE